MNLLRNLLFFIALIIGSNIFAMEKEKLSITVTEYSLKNLNDKYGIKAFAIVEFDDDTFSWVTDTGFAFLNKSRMESIKKNFGVDDTRWQTQISTLELPNNQEEFLTQLQDKQKAFTDDFYQKNYELDKEKHEQEKKAAEQQLEQQLQEMKQEQEQRNRQRLDQLQQQQQQRLNQLKKQQLDDEQALKAKLQQTKQKYEEMQQQQAQNQQKSYTQQQQHKNNNKMSIKNNVINRILNWVMSPYVITGIVGVIVCSTIAYKMYKVNKENKKEIDHEEIENQEELLALFSDSE